jgi:hypothetical protein
MRMVLAVRCSRNNQQCGRRSGTHERVSHESMLPIELDVAAAPTGARSSDQECVLGGGVSASARSGVERPARACADASVSGASAVTAAVLDGSASQWQRFSVGQGTCTGSEPLEEPA